MENVEAVTGQRGLEMRRDFLDARDDRGQRLLLGVEQTLGMRLRDHERVALGERVDVEIGDDLLVFVDLEARDLALGDRTENAVVLHTDYYSISPLPDGLFRIPADAVRRTG